MKNGRQTFSWAFLVLLPIAFSSAVWAASPEGRWQLVEQRYEAGGSNLLAADNPLFLEFTRDGSTLTGLIWAGGNRARALAWPAFVSDAGSIPVTALERSMDADSPEIRARYRVRPSSEDDLVLDIVERYRVEPDSLTLTGEMSVKFTGGATNRGGFTLHRRFRRAP